MTAQQYICPNCYRTTAENELLTVSEVTYCSKCVPPHNECESCGALVTEIHQVNDKYICKTCFDNTTSLCYICRNRFFNSEMVNELEHFTSSVCPNCFDRYFIRCDICMEYFHEDSLIYNENDDTTCCSDCYHSENGIQSHDYKPCPNFLLSKNEKEKPENLYFGIELEVENEQKVSINNFTTENWYYLKEDGSINYGFEIVTHPFTWLWYIENYNLFSNLLGKLRQRRFTSYQNKTCGIHIHLSRGAFSTLHFFRFLTFFYINEENKEFILKISQRLRDDILQWSSLWDTQTQDLVLKVKDGRSFARYTAVNTQNKNTYEIRIFKGTLNQKSFRKNIEFCFALYNWTKELNNNVPFIESLKRLTVQNFIKYVKNSTLYPNLLQFMINRKLCAS